MLELVICRDLCSLELEFVDGFKEVLLRGIITYGIAIDPSIDSYNFFEWYNFPLDLTAQTVE